MSSRVTWVAVVGAAVGVGLVLVFCVAFIFGAYVVTRPTSETVPSGASTFPSSAPVRKS